MDTPAESHDLGDRFRELFEIVPASNERLKDEVYRVRHEVYCRDLGWEPLRPDGMEYDEFDRHALHCLLRRRESREPVGCVRLILTNPEDPSQPLPMEASCGNAIDRKILDPSLLPRHKLGEISRLAVMRNYRQRKGEASVPVSVSDSDFGGAGSIPRFPFIPISLFFAVLSMGRQLGLEYGLVMTEPRLAAHLARIGFQIETIGRPTEHRGQRLPSVLRAGEVMTNLRPIMQPLYAVVEGAVEVAFKSHGDLRPTWG